MVIINQFIDEVLTKSLFIIHHHFLTKMYFDENAYEIYSKTNWIKNGKKLNLELLSNF